ncbi:MAG: CNNM domain-containing protein, partial [Candidatus Omnitrophica bacterium]|nr:CNNM domain-containing protein [Candidatus Omnitrophota bacterium]
MNAPVSLTLSVPLILLILAVLAFLSAFFSISETSIIGLSRIRLRHMVSKGIKHAKIIQGLITRIDRFISAILIGNNFVNIAISALVTALCVHLFGYKWGIIVATFGATMFILLVCEITPKIIATKHAERIALFVAPSMELLIKVLNPVVNVFTALNNLILRILRIGPTRRSPIVTEEEIRMMIEIGKEEGVLSDEERKMLHRIFEFGDTRVKDVMVPRQEMIAVERSATADKLLTIFVEEGHARLPVYDHSPENIIGIVYA